jgi:hypothetical protein
MIDLEDWFAAARRVADFFGMCVVVVEGELAMEAA